RGDAGARGQGVTDGVFQCLGDGEVGGGLGDRVRPTSGAGRVEGGDRLLLGREVAVERTRRDTRGQCDVLGSGGSQALFHEQSGRRAGDLHPGGGLAALGEGGGGPRGGGAGVRG